MTELQALQIAYIELSQLMPCEENKDSFEAADVIQKMIHKKKMQQIKQNAKRYQLNDKPHNALGITELDKIYAEYPGNCKECVVKDKCGYKPAKNNRTPHCIDCLINKENNT